eukprot:comp23784_c0_seq1/m.41268 comp23784_c0_seq1/g.41268  ORF comp23784_c0_seq1/g.41268 comp23784_c0_seq1/m.41268 type:complete len:885 (-) comp23784_c0_seq1:484-3138(-)
MAADHEEDPEVSGSEGESEAEAEDEEALAKQISILKHKVQGNAYDYGAQVEYIAALRRAGKLQEIRHAREKMSAVFPLTEVLWLEWLGDEARLGEDSSKLEALYERAVKDYLSVKVWVGYCKLLDSKVDTEGAEVDKEAVARARQLYERALSAAGLHYTEGASLWEAYRAFEQRLLDHAEEQEEDMDGPDSAPVTAAKKRIVALFKRQLAVPHASLQGTIEQLEQWVGEYGPDSDVPDMQKAAKRTQEACKALQPLEDALAEGGASAYLAYMQHEQQHGDDPARVQALCERAVAAHALDATVWASYAQYMDDKMPGSVLTLEVHARAVRNCPWVAALWQAYLQAMEVAGKDRVGIEGVFQAGLVAGFGGADDYVQLWTAYIDYQRRRVDWALEGEALQEAAQELRVTFKKAQDYLHHYFGDTFDPYCTLLQYRARVELWCLKRVDLAREAWDSCVRTQGKNPALWLAYIDMEKHQGDAERVRGLYRKAVQVLGEWAETVVEGWLLWERECGTLASYTQACKRTASHRKLMQDRRNQAATKEAERQQKVLEERQQRRAEKAQAKKEKTTADRKRPSDDTQGQGHTNKRHKAAHKEHKEEVVAQPPAPRTEENQACTVFVKNLLYAVTEDELAAFFSKVGEVKEVRLVRSAQGRSKGYAYVEFATPEPVEAAVALDRTLMGDRPMFIDRCQEQAEKRTHFPIGEDPSTLFVAGLPKDYTKEQVENLFKPYGALRQVRMGTSKKGQQRGFCYVEFEDEAAARKALAVDGMELADQPLKVAVSNPKARLAAQQSAPTDTVPAAAATVAPPSAGAGKASGAQGMQRSTTSMMPRTVRPHATPKPMLATRPKPSAEAQTQQQEKEKAPPQGATGLSNKDFKAFLLKKPQQ